MPQNTEKTLLQIDGDARGATNAIHETDSGLSQLGKSVSNAQKAFNSGANGLGDVAAAAGEAGNAADGAGGGLGSLLGMVANINPAAIVAALGLGKLLKALSSLKGEILATVGQAQTLQISIEALAARELVSAGAFENAGEAMEQAEIAGKHLLKQLRLIDKDSPFGAQDVINTFKSGMAYGFVSDQALKLTRASLDLASGLGMSGSEMSMIGMVMGQIRGTGKLLTQDLRQLSSRGVDLAAILKDQLGVSIDEFNNGLASGKFTMDDLLDSLVSFTEVNFAGAASKMAGTIQGITETLGGLKEVAISDMFKPFIDEITAAGSKVVDFVADLVLSSGVFERVGAFLQNLARNAVAFGEALVERVQPAFEAMSGGGGFVDGLRTAAFYVKAIANNIGLLARDIITLLQPAISSIQQAFEMIDFGPFVAQFFDYIHVILRGVNHFISSLRMLFAGEGKKAFRPLAESFVDVLTLMALFWDRFMADAVQWGWGFVSNLANGLWEGAKALIQPIMQSIGNLIGLFIKPGSPPKKGPLSHIVEWGRGVMETFIGAFKTADFGLLKESLSPIKSALQDAVRAGTLDEAGFVKTFGAVREQVASLIATFRETGKISDEALAGISERLGEGGDELVKFLRLQLQFRKAQEDLTGVQDEYAAAEAKGFVPQALKDKMRAAEEAANSAKEELDWQKGLLDVQKESVDLQLQLVNAMKDLTKELGKAAKAAGGAGGGGGAGAPLAVGPIESPLAALTGGFDGANQAGEAIAGLSEEFANMRQKVEGFLRLPLGEKLRLIAEKLGDAVGLDLEKIIDFFTNLKELNLSDIANILGGFAQKLLQNLILVVAGWFPMLKEQFPVWLGQLIELFKEYFNSFLESAPEWVGDLVEVGAKIINAVSEGIGEAAEDLGDRFDDAFSSISEIVTDVWETLKENFEAWKEKLVDIYTYIDETFGPLFEALGVLLGETLVTAIELAKDTFTDLRDNVRDGIAVTLDNLKKKFDEDILPVLESVRDFIRDHVIPIFSDLKKEIEENLGTALTWLKDEVITPLADKFSDIKDGIQAIIDKLPEADTVFSNMKDNLEPLKEKLDAVKGLFEGVASAVESVTNWLWKAIEAIRAWRDEKKKSDDVDEPDRDTDTKTFSLPTGQQIKNGFTSQVANSLANTQGELAAAGAAGINISMIFGENALSFPNVRDGRDAGGVVEELNRIAQRGLFTAKTRGK